MHTAKIFGLHLIIFCMTFFISGSSAQLVIAEIINTPEGVIITHYPDQFDLSGRIDRIDQKGVVVHDRYFSFAPRAQFMTPEKPYVAYRNFKEGDMVGLVLNDQRQVSTLCTIYQAE